MDKLILLLKGILIGFVSIAIPGVSASTIAIILLVYYEMIEAISSIFKNFKKSFSFLFFLVVGFGIGSVIGANLISKIYSYQPFLIVMLILGFIAGSLPRMFIDLRHEFKKVSNILLMIIIIGAVIGFSFLTASGEEVVLSFDMGLKNYLFLILVGLITAGTLVIPGMDFAVVLLALGYYTAFIGLLDVTNPSMILPNLAVLGVYLVSYGIGSFCLSKLIVKLSKKHESKMKFAILSFVMASPFAIIKQCIIQNDYFQNNTLSTWQIVVGIVLFVLAMIFVIVMYEFHRPNDTRIRAMKKRHMFRFFYTIGSQLPLAIYYLIKLKRVIRKNLLTFEERYALCMKVISRINKGGHIYLKVFGEENLNCDPTLYIFNHQGRYDGVAAFTVLKDHPCTMISDRNRIHFPMFYEMFVMLNGVYIDKSDMRKQVEIIKGVGERLQKGDSFVAFIEGKYGENGNTLQEFQTGVLHPAYDSHCQVVPIVLYDTYKVFSVSSIKRIEPEAHILEPLQYDDYKDLPKREFAELLKSRMQAKLDEISKEKLNK